MDAFLGMIMPFAGTYAPRGWALCNGQLLSVSSNPALFSILGIAYGGDGRTTFGLPNLNGRAIVGSGQLQGGGNYQVGQSGGAESVTLTTNQLPAHTHTLNGIGAPGTVPSPLNNFPAISEPGTQGQANKAYAPASAGTPAAMAGGAISSVGGGQPVPTTTPYQCVTYIICIEGIFPSRP